ncbi:MAG: hypothetical protein HYY35_02640 [Deltaproteobacteria bacterium]|nr:hypothetical protein [Deltaproteobacteria bacterium]
MAQLVDTESAREFMKEALSRISAEEMDAMVAQLRAKSRRFQERLRPERIPGLGADEIRALLRGVFSARRAAGVLLDETGVDTVRDGIGRLLYGPGSTAARFREFCGLLRGIDDSVRFDLASELLHYNDPDEYWLWTRWMWNPRNQTGALRLVTLDGYDFQGRDLGETYRKVGEAVAFVCETAKAAGFQRPSSGLFGTTVYLCLVYVIYLYTTLRLRLTQEFNRVVPEAPELTRRILGIHRPEER